MRGYGRWVQEILVWAKAPFLFSLAGEGLCVGRDSAEPVTGDYPGAHPDTFTGGTIKRVAVDVSGDPYLNLEREAQAMLARE
jgi:arylsulfatase